MPGPEALSLQAVTSDVQCFGAENGMAEVSVEGGSPGYQFLWNTFQSDSIVTQLTAGEYMLTVTDSEGCSDSLSLPIGEPLPTEILIDFAHPSCFGRADGMVTASASGGIPPYSFMWNDSFSDSLLSDLSAGLYQLELTDANGCTEQTEILLEIPDSLSISSEVFHASSLETADGAILISETNGGTAPYSYLWNTGANTSNIENLLPGTYMLTVIDSQGCENDYTYEVSFQTAVKNELSEQFEAFIYPNPSSQSGDVYLEIQSQIATRLHFQLFDISGRLLKEKPLNMIRQKMIFPLLPPENKGVYFIRLSAENGANKVLKCGVM